MYSTQQSCCLWLLLGVSTWAAFNMEPGAVLPPVSWAVVSFCAWLAYAVLRPERRCDRAVLWGLLAVFTFCSFLAQDSSFRGWGELLNRSGKRKSPDCCLHQAQQQLSQALQTLLDMQDTARQARLGWVAQQLPHMVTLMLCVFVYRGCVLLLWSQNAVLHMQLPLECCWLVQGFCAVELCAVHGSGDPAPGHTVRPLWIVARCVGSTCIRNAYLLLQCSSSVVTLPRGYVCNWHAITCYLHQPSSSGTPTYHATASFWVLLVCMCAAGEEVVTRESFISICWRLIPYWLNNWEQQWGAECSSMMFELPHFAVELLIILPCVQILCSRMKVLAMPSVGAALPPGRDTRPEVVQEESVPNVLRGCWERQPKQRHIWHRIR